MSDPDDQGEAAGEQPESADSTTDDTSGEAPPEEADEGGQPDIEAGEQAVIPAGLADVDPDEIEEAVGAGAADQDDADDQDDEPDAMEPAESAGSPAKAGEMYVSLVQSITNANIKKYGGPGAEPVDRDHFEQYDLSAHFNATMDQMGVGSDLEPHEALLLATALSVGDGLTRETDVMDQAIGQLMDQVIGAEEAA